MIQGLGTEFGKQELNGETGVVQEDNPKQYDGEPEWRWSVELVYKSQIVGDNKMSKYLVKTENLVLVRFDTGDRVKLQGLGQAFDEEKGELSEWKKYNDESEWRWSVELDRLVEGRATIFAKVENLVWLRFSKGDHVELRDLPEKFKEMNGQKGKILGWNPDVKLWVVELLVEKDKKL